MANEITFGYLSGKTLTYGAYQPSGTVRTAAGTSLPEIGTTGYYTATDASIAALDIVVVKDATSGLVVGYGQYQIDNIPATLTAIQTELAIIEANQTRVIDTY